ncbi:hypothetical protein A3D11_01640 [Candidatus Peribacteria bacterium RIFCSPHIGHO2_02_FULL_49_16]|nr:MAG: hypothetical protein A3D11_01640 [Candidatus Peribacteria bacterium RIFCSPHIGHO2_02_FULL_49_16]
MSEGILTQSSEIPERKRKEKKRSHLVDAGAFALALTAFDHGPAQALEITPQTSWNSAITENIRESVRQDKNESLFIYVQRSQTSGEWLGLTSGTRTEKGGYVALTFATQTLLAQPQYKNAENICIGHSHPSEIFRNVTPNSDAYKRLASPPSYVRGEADDDFQTTNETGSQFEKIFHIPKEKFVYFVADAHGIWYFRSMQESDYKNAEEKKKATETSPETAAKVLEAQRSFITRSLDQTVDLTTTTEYQNLQTAFRTIGGITRFVPYEKVSAEPACAGVDYKAKVVKAATKEKPTQANTKMTDGKTSVSLEPDTKVITMRPPE